MHPATRVVVAALADAGVVGAVKVLDASARTAREAAAALGCEVDAIANSLVFLADDEPVLVLTSGGHRVDTTYLAGEIGVRALHRASPEQVRAATGQAVGGVSPVGHPRPVPTFVDEALAAHPVVWAAAGTPHAVFPTSFEELVRICAGRPVAVVPPVDPCGAQRTDRPRSG